MNMLAKAPQRLLGCACVGIALSGATAQAHETWMLPQTFEPEAGSSVELVITSGMGFPALGSGIDRNRVIDAVVVQGKDRQALVPSRDREGGLELTAVPEPGLACAWVRLRQRILQIDEASDVEHYIDEIGIPDSLRDAWMADGRLWRESYSKVARSYFRAGGTAGSDACISETTSARFDILPLTDPTALAAGDTLELQVLFDGRPLAGQAVGVMREGADAMPLMRSGDDGRLALNFEGSGRHMIYATNLRQVKDGGDFNWESDFITLTFEVAAE
jgi:hypothetical protein